MAMVMAIIIHVMASAAIFGRTSPRWIFFAWHWNFARAAAWALQAAASCWSDHVTAGRYSLWHLADRLMAPAATAYVAALSVSHCGVPFTAACAAPVFGVKEIGSAARRRLDKRAYVFWHSLWHILGGPVAAVVMWASRGEWR